MPDLVETSLRQILAITSRDHDSLRQAQADMATIHGIADLALRGRVSAAATVPVERKQAE